MEERAARDDDRRWWLAALALWALAALVFLPEVAGWRSFYLYDLQYYFYPYRKAALDVVRAGHLPLWNPYANSGMPLLGDGQVGLFFPPNWWGFLAGAERGMALSLATTVALAGTGVLVWGRRAGASPIWAGAAGAGFMFGGFFAAHVVHPSIAAAAAMSPWVLWGADGVIWGERMRARRYVAGALAVAMQVFSGHPQLAIYCGLGVGAYAGVMGLRGGVAGVAKAWARVGGMYLAGLALSGVQLVPWVELMTASPRARHVSFEMYDSYSMRWADWLMYLFPYGFGGPTTSWMQSSAKVPIERVIYVWERLPSVGIAGLTLAAWGALAGVGKRAGETLGPERRWRTWGLLAMAALAVVIAAGGGTPLGKLAHAMPVIGQLRAQSRALGVASLALAGLAMFGGEDLARRLGRGRAGGAWMAVAAVIFAAVVALAVAGKAMLGVAGAYWSGANVGVPVAIALAGLVAVGMTGARRPGVRRAGLATLACLWVGEVACVSSTFNPTVEAGAFGRTPGVVAFLRAAAEKEGPFRVGAMYRSLDVPLASAQAQLNVSWAMAYGIEDLNGFNSLQPRRLVDLLWGEEWDDVTYGLLSPKYLALPKRHVLDALDVRYVLLQRVEGWAWPVPEGWDVAYEDAAVMVIRNRADPHRAFVADRVTRAADPHDALRRVADDADFDPARMAVLDGPGDAASLSAAGEEKWEATRETWGPNEQTWRARRVAGTGAGQRLLVLSETFWPGWLAEGRGKSADGTFGPWQRLTTVRANYMFRGIEIPPAAELEVRLVYRPASVMAGAALSGAAVVGAVAASRRGRRARDADSA